ncbi:MAG: acyl-CoA dehydrogenase family protein, partial [Acidimicrobiales bacterium]
LRLDGVARFVPDAHVAGGIVVCARGADGSLLFTVVDPKAAGVSVEVEATVDQTRRLASVALDDVRVGDAGLLAAPGELDDLHARLTSLGAWAVCADAAGTAERSLEMAVAYAKQRRQFGRPIGSFQAVKHHLANMLVAVEGSRAAVAHASAAFDNGGPGVHEAASVAKSFVGPACAQVCETAIQVHGGIGFTWEHDAHLYLKRAKLDEALFGSTSWHRRRLGRGLVAVQ